jgi:hypothetical protein
VNSVVFGIGAAVTIRVLGLILDPRSSIPGWLALALMPLFGFVMWVALRPFRRLTSMVAPGHLDPFAEGAGALGGAARSAGRWTRRAVATGVGVYTGNVAAAATIGSVGDTVDAGAAGAAEVPERVEARPLPDASVPSAPTTSPSPALPALAIPRQRQPQPPPVALGSPAAGWQEHSPGADSSMTARTSEPDPLAPVEPEWFDGEEVFTVYRPSPEDANDAA